MKNVLLLASLRAWSAALLLVAGASAQAKTQVVVKGMPEQAPLAVSASHDAATLRIHFELQDGWHLYGRDVGGGQPVTVRLGDGAFAAAGALVTPMDDKGLITGAGDLKLPLRRVAAGEALTATMSFMVCDALQCLPPIELELSAAAAAAPAGPFRVLLVAVDEGERTDRIARFLAASGLVPTVATYATVTPELCDAYEVVIADSPTFGQVRGKKVDARSFPKTKSPVVAVGFLGTELLEAHKVAMACGYI